MSDNRNDLSRYILELESKIEILENENAQLAERGEDTLLLGIISEEINAIEDINELLLNGLEKISLLKNIPFCACCKAGDNRLIINKYFFLQSNDRLVSTELIFPDEIQNEIIEKNSVIFHCRDDRACPVIELETMKFLPTSLLIIYSRSVVRDAEIFCFALAENGKRLSYLTPLLERVVEMITARIDTLTLLSNLKGLNKQLDERVRERTNELAQANQDIKGSERKFRDIFNEALDMIHFVSLEGKIIDANPAELKTLQYSQEEFLGMRLVDVVDPAFQDKTKKALSRVLSGEEIRGFQTVLLAKDGSRVDVEVNAVPVMDGGKVRHVLAILRNVSDRKQVEEQHLKIKKLESIGVLAGGIAHDFNNILAAILGNISLALQIGDPQDRIYSLLTEAEKGSLRAKELIHQLLTFSKGGEPVKEVSSIVDVIRDSAGFVLRGTNIRCIYSFAENMWPVAIDRGQISQVIQNLVINARHAMPTGGDVEIAAENYMHDQSQILPLEPGRYIKLTITDHGVGIPADHIDRIFDPYFTTKHEGSGLGLAVTNSIIVKHHGYIEVESEQGKGSRFTIYLPATIQHEKSVEVEVDKDLLKGHGKILLMDDEEMVRDIAGNMLAHAGYEVVLARRGEEALELIKKEDETSAPVAAVILDLTIPGGLGGKETAEILCRSNPDIPLIVSSGYTNDPVMRSYQEYGFCAAIVKPFKFDELIGTVQKALS